MNYTTFVGGASDGVYGTAAMDLWSGTLRKHGAWLFGDSAFVHMGAGISCRTAGTDAGTTLANHLLQGPVLVQRSGAVQGPAALGPGSHNLTDVDFVFHARYADGTRGTAYFPLSPSVSTLEVALANRTGDWSALGTDSGNITRATLTVLARHGACPLGGASGHNASFAYAVMPNVSLPAAQAFARARAAGGPPAGSGPSVTVLANTNAIQAAVMPVDGGQELTAAVFWDETQLALKAVAKVTAPCVLLLRRAANTTAEAGPAAAAATTVTVSSPVFTGEITVTLDGGLHQSCRLTQGQGKLVDQGNGVLTFTLPSGDYLGQSQVATCT